MTSSRVGHRMMAAGDEGRGEDVLEEGGGKTPAVRFWMIGTRNAQVFPHPARGKEQRACD